MQEFRNAESWSGKTRMAAVGAALICCCCAGRDTPVAAPAAVCPELAEVAKRAAASSARVGPLEDARLGIEECPDSAEAYDGNSGGAYEAFVRRALGVAPDAHLLLSIRISPSFERQRAISLRRTAEGGYLLRAVRLRESAWQAMIERMRQQQGAEIRMDEASQARAVRGLEIEREVRERYLDSATANQLLELWDAVWKRESVVDDSGEHFITMDGTSYRVWTRAGAIAMANPRGALGMAAESTRKLEVVVFEPSANDCQNLASFATAMAEALERVRASPCRVRPRPQRDAMPEQVDGGASGAPEP